MLDRAIEQFQRRVRAIKLHRSSQLKNTPKVCIFLEMQRTILVECCYHVIDGNQ